VLHNEVMGHNRLLLFSNHQKCKSMFLELRQFSAHQSNRGKSSTFGPDIIDYRTIKSLSALSF
jgi:hypothetical protein